MFKATFSYRVIVFVCLDVSGMKGTHEGFVQYTNSMAVPRYGSNIILRYFYISGIIMLSNTLNYETVGQILKIILG